MRKQSVSLPREKATCAHIFISKQNILKKLRLQVSNPSRHGKSSAVITPFNKTKIKRKSNFCLISALFTYILEWIAWLLRITRWEIKLYITHLLAQASSKQLIAEVCHKLREFGCCLLYLLYPWYILNRHKSLCCQKPIKIDRPPQEYRCDWIDWGFETILFIFLNVLSEGYTETWISEMLFVLYEEINACEWFLTKVTLAIKYW